MTALMADIFFSVGLELKREMLEGQLKGNFKSAFAYHCDAWRCYSSCTSFFAAINWGDATRCKAGRPPTATDIAFAVRFACASY